MKYTRYLLLVAFALLMGLAAACDTDQPDAPDPLIIAEANRGAWTWIRLEGMQCRDGSPTGIGVRLQEDADDLVIFLEGGGACFLGQTCAQNRASFGEADFEAGIVEGYGDVGLFNAENEANPVRDWHVVYVPYCTGDVHTGSRTDATADSLGIPAPQQFVGFRNAQRVLEALDYHFDEGLDRVLLAGASAGGFGTLGLYKNAAATFGEAEVTLLNDSGPVFFDDTILSPLLQALWFQLWNQAPALPSQAVFPPDGFENIYDVYATTYPDAQFGLLSFDRDATIRFFFSFSRALQSPACADSLSRETPCIGAAEYVQALATLRAEHLPASWATYYAPGTEHTFLRAERFYTTEVDGLSPAAWLGQLLEGDAPNVAPPDGE